MLLAQMAKEVVEPNRIKLAPCGINCEACYLHLRKNNPCRGCWEPKHAKAERCQNCKIIDCLTKKAIRFCFECADFPCDLIEQLNREYRHQFRQA